VNILDLEIKNQIFFLVCYLGIYYHHFHFFLIFLVKRWCKNIQGKNLGLKKQNEAGNVALEV
jgi:hypothetical protein